MTGTMKKAAVGQPERDPRAGEVNVFETLDFDVCDGTDDVGIGTILIPNIS